MKKIILPSDNIKAIQFLDGLAIKKFLTIKHIQSLNLLKR